MKRLKRIMVLAAVLVVACIATIAVTQYEVKKEKIKNSDAVILEIKQDTVQSLSWEVAGSGLAFHRADSGWQYDDDGDFPVSEEKITEILDHFEAFGVSFIIEQVEDYGQYGLDAPEGVIYLTTEDNSYEIKLGDFSKMDQQRYIEIGDGNVYLVNTDPVDYLETELSAMIYHDTVPDWDRVESIELNGSEQGKIVYASADEESIYRQSTYSLEDIYFTEQEGVVVPLNTDAVEAYLEAIDTLSLTTYATYNATVEEMAGYGLDIPELSVTLQYTDTDENHTEQQHSFVIHIGSNQEELAAAQEAQANGEEEIPQVTRYVRMGTSQIVYLLNDTAYETLAAASYEDLRHKEMFWAEFELVTRMEVVLEEQSHVFSSTLDEEVEDNERLWYYGDVEAQDGTASQMGQEIQLQSLQEAVAALTADRFTEEIPNQKEEISLTLYLEDDNFPQVNLRLYRYDGSLCLAVVNGQSVALVSRSAVMELVEAVQEIVLDQ